MATPTFRVYRPLMQYAQDPQRMELVGLTQPHEKGTSDIELDRIVDARYAVATRDKARYEEVMAKAGTLPATARLLRKAYDQYTMLQGEIQEQKAAREADAVAARNSRDDLERQLREANERADREREQLENVIKSLQRNLDDAARLRNISLNSADALVDQFLTFAQQSHGTASTTEWEQMITKSHNTHVAAWHETVKRSSTENGLKQVPGGDFESDLLTYAQEVRRKCLASEADQAFHERLTARVEQVYQYYSSSQFGRSLSLEAKLDTLFDNLDNFIQTDLQRATGGLSISIVEAMKPFWDELQWEPTSSTIVEQAKEFAHVASKRISYDHNLRKSVHGQILKIIRDLNLSIQSAPQLSSLQLLSDLELGVGFDLREAREEKSQLETQCADLQSELRSIALARDRSVVDLHLDGIHSASNAEMFDEYVKLVTNKIAALKASDSSVQQAVEKLANRTALTGLPEASDDQYISSCIETAGDLIDNFTALNASNDERIADLEEIINRNVKEIETKAKASGATVEDKLQNYHRIASGKIEGFKSERELFMKTLTSGFAKLDIDLPVDPRAVHRLMHFLERATTTIEAQDKIIKDAGTELAKLEQGYSRG